MSKVTPNQLIGNQGEALVGYLLSKFSLVRPVANGTDIGVDLYCETITADQPNNHFLVQVKSSNKEQSSISLERDKILYWWRQPMPVFIFLISPKIDYTNQQFCVHVIDLTERYLEDNTIESDSKTLCADFRIDSADSMRKFIDERVPVATARLWLKEGVILPAKPNVTLDYFKYYPADGCRNFSNKIRKHIGRSAAMLLSDIMVHESKNPQYLGQRRHLECILESFSKYGNWDIHFALGWSKFDDQDWSGARPCLEKALECIETDGKVKQDDWVHQKKQIKEMLVRIKCELENANHVLKNLL